MEMMVDVSNYKLMQTSLDSSEMKYFDFFSVRKLYFAVLSVR